jgi:hypothetical protein
LSDYNLKVNTKINNKMIVDENDYSYLSPPEEALKN